MKNIATKRREPAPAGGRGLPSGRRKGNALHELPAELGENELGESNEQARPAESAASERQRTGGFGPETVRPRTVRAGPIGGRASRQARRPAGARTRRSPR
ncbi:hypothetical protein [Streptomyces sp. NPDC048252]|uniref:hypothetical protein n=1 Tax=Streptomyces sp. NPDC048252 TaxID=3154612 RepID=UPI003431527D